MAAVHTRSKGPVDMGGNKGGKGSKGSDPPLGSISSPPRKQAKQALNVSLATPVHAMQTDFPSGSAIPPFPTFAENGQAPFVERPGGFSAVQLEQLQSLVAPLQSQLTQLHSAIAPMGAQVQQHEDAWGTFRIFPRES